MSRFDSRTSKRISSNETSEPQPGIEIDSCDLSPVTCDLSAISAGSAP
jgi:hypothetical protein